MMIIIISLISAVVVLILTLLFQKTRSQEEGQNLPPGSFGWPFLGEALEFVRLRLIGSPQTFTQSRMEKYNSQVFKTRLLGQPMAVLCGPAASKFLFSNESKSVALWWPETAKGTLGKCISTARGPEAMQMRKMVSGFMSPVAFNKFYIKTINVVSKQHINTHWKGKDELKVYPTIKLYTFELACRLFFSIEDPKKIKELATHFNLFNGIISWLPIDIPGTRFYKAKRAAVAIKKELRAIVRQRRDTLEQKGSAGTPQDLLSHLLVSPDENGKLVAESVIVNNVLLLLFGGHDTLSSAITMLMKTLAEYPQVYQNVLKEQREISSSKKPGEFLEWEDIQKMKYSWSVISENMRLWPPAAGIIREVLSDINFGGYDIPKGWKRNSINIIHMKWKNPQPQIMPIINQSAALKTPLRKVAANRFYTIDDVVTVQLILDIATTHRESDLYPDSAKFDPARFEGAGPAPFSYVPFGGGPRMCIGKEFARLEMLTFLNNVITKFKWELLIPGEKFAYPLPTPEKGLPIRLQQHM